MRSDRRVGGLRHMSPDWLTWETVGSSSCPKWAVWREMVLERMELAVALVASSSVNLARSVHKSVAAALGLE